MEADLVEAETHFSQLLERVSLGEEIAITRAGEPVARLVPAAKPPRHRRLGWAAGEFTVPDDFDAPLPSGIEESFYR
ncbi:MAG: type II toxin-antitoxin system Phd/YefM family antitoxin [Bryobacteraceae bacterium]|jgi:prevent-host-death family protein